LAGENISYLSEFPARRLRLQAAFSPGLPAAAI